MKKRIVSILSLVLILELGDTELMHHADNAMGKTKQSEVEAPEGE
jgi:hypothetical protein